MSKKFLVTGGAGFIGTTLVQYLVEEGHGVKVVDDLRAGKRERLPHGIEFYEQDITDTEALKKLCVGVDVVVHLAALPQTQYSIDEPSLTHGVNVNGTLSVLEAARFGGVTRVVLASSAGVYGDQLDTKLSPKMKPSPKTPYALHKYIGEQYLALWSELYDMETVSLRFFNVYGPHFDPNGAYALVIGRFLKQASLGEPLTITGDGEQTRDFVHVKDVARAIVCASLSTEVGKGEVCNVGSGVQTTINDLAAMISPNRQYLPARIEIRATEADISETKKLLGWSPQHTLHEGMEELKKECGLYKDT